MKLKDTDLIADVIRDADMLPSQREQLVRAFLFRFGTEEIKVDRLRFAQIALPNQAAIDRCI